MNKPLWRQTIDRWKSDDPDKWMDWMERAAIMEIDGLLSREDAERRAWEIVAGKEESPVHR